MTRYVGWSICLLLFFLSCMEGEEPSPENNMILTEEELFAKADRQFTFTPNQNFEALYFCLRQNSQLAWYFSFQENGNMQVLFTTDTHEDFAFEGLYTYSNDVLSLQMAGGPSMPFPNGLNESSLLIMPQWGLLAAFATSEMVCICQGHNLNQQAPPKTNANYDCPNINFQAASDEDNAIEFVHRAAPFEIPVWGSIFRQRDIYVNGLTNPLITRGYGIYRQVGDEFYASFRVAEDFVDFARGKLPYELGRIASPFEDFNVLSGRIISNGQEVIIDQLKPEAGSCRLR